jgi:predicted nucleic acid-binding protein
VSDTPRRRLLVDASAFITLAGIDRVDLLRGIDSNLVVPAAVEREVADEPAASRLGRAVENGWIRVESATDRAAARDRSDVLADAAAHLGEPDPGTVDSDGPEGDEFIGDVALLALALLADDAVVITDDKPLRKACTSLGIAVSGSLGVVIAAVERGDLEAGAAKDALVAMDEVGARLSARLLRRAERLIDEAAAELDDE